MLTKNGILTLVDVVIADPMLANLLHRFCATQGFATFDVGEAKERSYCNQHPIDQFLPLAIEVFGCLHKHADVFLHDYANAIWFSSFYLGHFSLSKSFDHITKDVSVFHLKLGGSRRFNYFPTSTPSRHTSHHHGRFIVNRQFLTYKYDWPIVGGQLFTWRKFHTYFEPTWCLVTSPFTLILLLCTFS